MRVEVVRIPRLEERIKGAMPDRNGTVDFYRRGINSISTGIWKEGVDCRPKGSFSHSVQEERSKRYSSIIFGKKLTQSNSKSITEGF